MQTFETGIQAALKKLSFLMYCERKNTAFMSSVNFILIILLITIWPIDGKANNAHQISVYSSPCKNADRWFAYVNKIENAESFPDKVLSTSYSVPDYKYETASRVFEALVEAKGIFSLQRPEMVMTQSEIFVAWMDPGRVTVGLEEKAYDVCTGFGPDSLNALAAILSHELTHYYEKHYWESPLGLASDDNPDSVKQEEEADYLGGFLSFAAGFNSVGIIPQFLTKVYNTYSLPENLQGYPPLPDRIALADKSIDRSRELVFLYEAAIYLVALEKHDEAAHYYKAILKDFQSREIYNNAGVNLVLNALTYFSDQELQFIFPFELDAETRIAVYEVFKKLFSRPKSANQQEIILREQLLQEAIRLFDRAAILDYDYPTAILNKAGVLELLKQHRSASYWAEEAILSAQNLHQEQVLTDAQILMGIITANRQDTLSAEKYFDLAMEAGSQLAEINRRVLKGEKLESEFVLHHFERWASRGDVYPITEHVEGVDLNSFGSQFPADSIIEVMDDPDRSLQVVLGYKIFDHSLLFATSYQSEQLIEDRTIPRTSFTLIHFTMDEYPGQTTKGIKLYDTKSAVQEQYGTPERIVALVNGALLIYYSTNLIFQIGEDGKVEKWAVFLEGE